MSWDGSERRNPTQIDISLEHLKTENEQLKEKLDRLIEDTEVLKAQVAKWETAAAVIRFTVISTAGLVAFLISIHDWWSRHK